MTLLLVKEPPKKQSWKIEVDGRSFETEEDILEIARGVLRGNAFYMKTNFRDPKTGGAHAHRNKKHFSDGYWRYTFWFNRKRDAALFKMMTDS